MSEQREEGPKLRGKNWCIFEGGERGGSSVRTGREVRSDFK